MPAKPSYHVSSFIFRISGLFRISVFGFRISPDLSALSGLTLCLSIPNRYPSAAMTCHAVSGSLSSTPTLCLCRWRKELDRIKNEVGGAEPEAERGKINI